MKDRHHYDSEGNYLGKTSERPPAAPPGFLKPLIFVLIFVCAIWPVLQLFGVVIHFMGPLAIFALILLLVATAMSKG